MQVFNAKYHFNKAMGVFSICYYRKNPEYWFAQIYPGILESSAC